MQICFLEVQELLQKTVVSWNDEKELSPKTTYVPSPTGMDRTQILALHRWFPVLFEEEPALSAGQI